MTKDQLWAAIFLAAAAFQAWRAFSSASSDKWTFRTYRLTVDHRASPIVYWICISWDLMVMTVMLALAAFELTR